MDAQFTGNQISRLRKEKGLTQLQLAEKVHVTDKAVSKWERGVNYPDLGLMEALAQALDTTPAVLLGLEHADQTETLSTLVEISQTQLSETQQDVAFLGWGSLAAALLLCIGNSLAQRGAGQLYLLFRILIPLAATAGLVFLFRCGQIKKWGVRELGSFCGSLFPLLCWLGCLFFTGSNPQQWLVTILAVISAVFAQIHFLQVMKARLMQMFPLILSILYLIWSCIMGGARVTQWLLFLACLAVLLIHSRKNPQFRKIHWASVGVTFCFLTAGILLLCALCRPMIARSYLLSHAQDVQRFAEAKLASTETADHFGPFEVHVFPELGLVQFDTGGYGLVPESTYEGLYYSASGTHVCFPGFVPAEDYGATALFRDPEENSDNWQKSTQITEHLYWFELHY